MKQKQKVSQGVVITGILSLVALEMMAMMMGINGKLFSLVIMVIALAIGVAIPNPFRR